MKWKVAYPDGTVEYLDPNDITLIMHKCKLRNSSKIAERIFKGENKTVCAWILCSHMKITGVPQKDMIETSRLRYNPRVTPNWSYQGDNVDGKEFDVIESRGNKLYII